MRTKYFSITAIVGLFFSINVNAQVLTSSNLPIIIINTNGLTIVDEPKIVADMGIIYNGVGVRNNLTDSFNNYNGKIGIEYRGSSSQWMPQKPYGIRTQDLQGLALNVSLLGMPADNDWALYAPYDDKTCIRNILTFKIGRELGQWAPRTVLCELVVNGSYEGIYVLMEKVKKGNNRVNISKLDLDDNAGDSLTGGYIIKVDKTTGNFGGSFPSAYYNNYNYQYHYPDGSDMTVQQKVYIKQFVDSFENAMYGVNFADTLVGYKKYIKVGSFIDFMIVNEISRNVDGYRISSYLHKDKYSKGGNLVAGPLWDFNLAWWNADYCRGFMVDGWMYDFNAYCGGGLDVPAFWPKLMTDSNYNNRLRCRWDWLRTKTLDLNYLDTYIDSLGNYLNEAQQRHFQRWPIIGIYTWPNPSPIPTSYQGELDALKTWNHNRFPWLDDNWPGTCYSVGLDGEGKTLESSLSVYPNPASSNISMNYFLSAKSRVTIQLVNSLGETIRTIDLGEQQPGSYQKSIDGMDKISNGVYLLKLSTNQTIISKSIVKSE